MSGSGAFERGRWMAVLLLCAAGGRGQEAPRVRSLSLDDCVREAIARNHDIRIARHEPRIAAHRLRLALGGYDPTVRLEAQRESEETPGGLDDFNEPVTGSESDTMRYTLSLGGVTPFGASYSLNATARDSSGDKRMADPAGGSRMMPFEAAIGRATFLELRQPLVKDRDIDETRYTVRLRRADLRISELTLRERLLAVVGAVEQAYFDLLAARETVRVRQAALDLAERLARENELRVQIGVMEPLDERQARAQIAASRADWLDAKRALAVQENTLKNLIADNLAAWEGVTIEPSGTLNAEPAEPDAAASRAAAFRHRPDLAQLEADLDRRDLTTAYQRNQILPQIDLVGSYGHAASSDEMTGAIDQFRDGSFPFYTIGLAFSMPLGNRRARETWRAGLVERGRAADLLRQARQTVEVEIDNAIVAIRSSFERVAATREARSFAEAALEAGETKLATGRLRSFEALQLQRDATSARAEEVRALADYNKALSLLRLREGTTLQRYGIEVETEPER